MKEVITKLGNATILRRIHDQNVGSFVVVTVRS